jgi:hypothetical protein
VTRVAAFVAAAWGLVFAVFAYPLMRGVQGLTTPPGDPGALTWGVHPGFFWRGWIAAYAGGLAAFVVFWIARARPLAAARALPAGIAIAAAALAAQSALLP